MPGLFEPFDLRDLHLRNRIGMSPMCQYKAQGDGVPTAWHRTHYRSRAVGGTGLVLTEMTDVEPDGRITDGCLGLWNDVQCQAFAVLADEVHAEGAAFGVQIAHAGRKSTLDTPVAPSAVPFANDRVVPRALQHDEIQRIVASFGAAARRAVEAGCDVVELHGAHGYLIHQFLSPVSNLREDEYGEPSRFALETIRSVRAAMPTTTPLMMRVSMREYQSGGYDAEHVLALLPSFVEAGVDLFDVSSGGDSPVRPQAHPGYHLPLAAAVRERLHVPVATVGMMHSPVLADHAVREGHTDLVLIGRAMLRSPYWAYEAARELGVPYQMAGEYAKGI